MNIFLNIHIVLFNQLPRSRAAGHELILRPFYFEAKLRKIRLREIKKSLKKQQGYYIYGEYFLSTMLVKTLIISIKMRVTHST